MAGLIGGKRSLMKTMLSDKYVDLIADHGWELCSGYAAFAGTQEDPVLESPDRTASGNPSMPRSVWWPPGPLQELHGGEACIGFADDGHLMCVRWVSFPAMTFRRSFAMMKLS
ncbi:hypothetical protein ACVWZ8_003057 [Arthrobacter sp. UYCu723]